MATNFPTSLDSLTNPTSTDPLNSPSHADQHANVNDAVEALEAKVGVNGSAVTTSLDYKVEKLTGGTTGQVLKKLSNTNFDVQWQTDISGRYYVGDTAPSSPTAGDVWFESDTGRTFVYYDLFWVEFGANAGIPLPGSNGDVLVSDSGSTSGLRWQGQANTGRNLVINGAMQVAQRGTSSTGITGEGYYTADRWYTQIVTQGTWTNSVENDGPAATGLQKSIKLLCTTADASPAAGDSARIRTIFEGQDLQRVKKGSTSAEQLTLSFWVKSNVTGTYVVTLLDADNSRQVGAQYTVSASATWEKKTVTFPADTTGAFDNDNARSMDIIWWLGAGTDRTSGTLRTSWTSTTTADLAVGQTNVAAATNNYWQITGVQLEVGPVATGFDFEPYETTLRKCQRYYFRSKANSAYSYFGNPGYGATTTVVYVPFVLPTAMRTYPSSLEYGGQISVSDTVTRWKGGTWTIDSSGTPISPLIGYTHTGTNITQFRPYGLQADNDSATYVAFSAEL